MEISVIQISEEERLLLSKFFGEEYIGNKIDFNRLMPVVEKIETMEVYNHRKNQVSYVEIVTMYDERTEFKGWSAHVSFVLGSCLWESIQKYESKINATYQAVLSFIKIYNESKSTN